MMAERHLSVDSSTMRPHTALAAKNLSLRKQLALFREREKAMPTTPADRFVFSKLVYWFDWRSALMIVKPATLIGWHRKRIPPLEGLHRIERLPDSFCIGVAVLHYDCLDCIRMP